MSEHDVEKLLGGFAADTLMPEERIRLYTAAMQDQQIVNALTDEQALKELLADPQVRDRLLQASRKPGTSEDSGSLSWWGRLRRPAGLAFAGGLAAVLFAVAFGIKFFPAPAVPPEQRAERDEAQKQVDVQAPAGATVTGAAAPTLGARALFYGNRPVDAAAAPRPLGLRYSFVVREPNGQEREVDAPTAAKSTGPVRINIEANQDAFVQILQSLGASGTRLWWPPQETGKISLKVIAGKRTEIPLPPPAEDGSLRLIARLSPKPFAPLTMQEVGMLDRFAANLLIESTAPGGTGAQEQATYVVSQDSSQTAQMTVEIPIRY